MRTRNKKTPLHIVVIGGGFGGVYTAKYLVPLIQKGLVTVTLISKENYFLFTPLLHEVATGGLSPESVVEPLREVFRGTGVLVVEDTVVRISVHDRVVHGKNGVYPYDYVVVATGASTRVPSFVTPGALWVHTLKSLADARAIRNALIEQFEKAVALPTRHKRKKALSFVVVGAGPTGVETVAEIADFTRIALCAYFKDAGIQSDDVSITLVGSSVDVVPQFHPAVREYVADVLKKKGIRLMLGLPVSSVKDYRVVLSDTHALPASLVVWSAGVVPVAPPILGGIQQEKSGRVLVDQSLRVIDVERVFALGDVAAFYGGQDGSRPLPSLAQVAVRQARVVASSIEAACLGKTLPTFSYQIKGLLLSLGQWNAAADMLGVRFYGKSAWWFWRTVYLFNFTSWRKRFRVAMEWTINLFSPRDITRIR